MLYEPLLTRFFPDLKIKGDEAVALCPFHEETVPSLGFHLDDGRWHCFGCGMGGTFADFYALAMGISLADAERFLIDYLRGEPIPTPVTAEELEAYCQDLPANVEVLSYLARRGITQHTVDTYMLGAEHSCLALPVMTSAGYCVNIRLHSVSPTSKRTRSFRENYGTIRFFPHNDFHSVETILLCEGEVDALLARQLGFHAWSSTGGAQALPKNASYVLAKKTVVICYDADDAGMGGAQKAVQQLNLSTTHILPLPQKSRGYDFTDYILDPDGGVENFRSLYESILGGRPTELSSIPVLDLFDARDARYIGQEVRFAGRVIGKYLSPYDVPTVIQATCGQEKTTAKSCQRCALFHQDRELIWEIDVADKGVLALIRCSDKMQRTAIAEMLGIPPKCGAPVYTIEGRGNIEEVVIIPHIEPGVTQSGTYTTQNAYYMGYGIIPNRPYMFVGTRVTDPLHQTATFLLKQAEPVKGTLDDFSIDETTMAELENYRTTNTQALWEHMSELVEHCEAVTKIYGRRDLIETVLLVYASVIGFVFNQTPVRRGWLEALILGDTGTGKTEFCSTLMSYLKLGDMALGENATFAGLVGGLQKVGDRFAVTWGKIPQNDRMLLFIDELSGLSVDEIACMSGIRSSGVAELTKIITETTVARTRLVWIANPRDGSSLLEFAYGVEAIKPLFGKLEDISRLDLVVSAAADEVDATIINMAHDPPDAGYTNAKLLRTLILWGWSRQPNQVRFLPGTTEYILQQAIILGREYSPSIPLVSAAFQRIKLARVAAAYAVLSFSTPDGEILEVHPHHAERAVMFLHTLFKKASLDYAGFSRKDLEGLRPTDETRQAISHALQRWPAICDAIMAMSQFTVRDLSTVNTALDEDTIHDALSFLFTNKALAMRGYGRFVKRRLFVEVYKEKVI